MALTIITGSSGSGKTTKALKTIIDLSLADPTGRFYVIVPEQSTMQTQKDLINLHPGRGIMNIDVLSFNRLAYRVFQEIGFHALKPLEEIGKTFLLEKIALEQKKKLAYFGSHLVRPENLAEMKALISELMLYGDSPESLASAGEGGGGRPASFDLKMQDVSLIYREFMKKLEGSLMTAEEVPDILCSVADRSEKLKDSVIVLDGFTGFTPIQLKLVEKLLGLTRDLYVTATLDQREDPFARVNPQNLFWLSHQMLRSLKDLADKTGTKIKPLIRLDEGKSRHQSSKELTFLERNLLRRGHAGWEGEIEDIHIRALKNPRREAEETARLIHSLNRQGFRYREIGVVSGDPATYSNYIRQVFGEWKIPYFLDEKRGILTNPFAEFVRAALAVCADSYRYESIFRLLKSGMTDFTDDEIEHLENYALGCGIRGKSKWRTDFSKLYRGQDPDELDQLNALRKRVTDLLDPLADAFSKRGSTVRDKSLALYEFCVRSRAEEKLKERRDRFEAEGRQDLAREYDQVYPKIMSFLDKLVEVLGDEQISMSDYRDLVEAGLSEVRIGIIPPGSDMVLCGDLERSRLGEVRVLIVLGVNEGLIPKKQAAGGILSEADREKLETMKVRLKPTARSAMYIERFYLYLALTKPSEQLYLSFSKADPAGEALRPAFLIGVLQRLYPDLAIEEDLGGQPDLHLMDRVECADPDLALLTEGIQRIGEKLPGQDYQELFAWYRANPEFSDRVDLLLRAAGSRKATDRIGQAAATALYGRDLVNSASRLERFCECEFKHFLQYGLRLRDRPDFSFSGMDRGSVIHDALDRYAKRMKEAGKSWEDGTGDVAERFQLAQDLTRQAVEDNGSQVLFDSERSKYSIYRMTELVDQALKRLSDQLEAGDFHVEETEAEFRQTADLNVRLAEDGESARMTLTGKIDRIDTCEDEEGRTLVKIIDYKTGNVEFDLSRVYYGLQMQLVLYLNEALEKLRKEGRQAVPAGIFYCRIKDPIVRIEPGDSKEQIEQKLLDSIKASGILLKDETAIRHLDRRMAEDGEGQSHFYPVGRKKKGRGFLASSKLVGPEAFETLGTYVRHKVQKSAELILSGQADVNPYRIGSSQTACQFCDYKGICGFDLRIPGYRYRDLKKLDHDEILEKMANGEDDREDEMDDRPAEGH